MHILTHNSNYSIVLLKIEGVCVGKEPRVIRACTSFRSLPGTNSPALRLDNGPNGKKDCAYLFALSINYCYRGSIYVFFRLIAFCNRADKCVGNITFIANEAGEDIYVK